MEPSANPRGARNSSGLRREVSVTPDKMWHRLTSSYRTRVITYGVSGQDSAGPAEASAGGARGPASKRPTWSVFGSRARARARFRARVRVRVRVRARARARVRVRLRARAHQLELSQDAGTLTLTLTLTQP